VPGVIEKLPKIIETAVTLSDWKIVKWEREPKNAPHLIELNKRRTHHEKRGVDGSLAPWPIPASP
jgi:hypothetical protein